MRVITWNLNSRTNKQDLTEQGDYSGRYYCYKSMYFCYKQTRFVFRRVQSFL